jgi:hypothetical protein
MRDVYLRAARACGASDHENCVGSHLLEPGFLAHMEKLYCADGALVIGFSADCPHGPQPAGAVRGRRNVSKAATH